MKYISVEILFLVLLFILIIQASKTIIETEENIIGDFDNSQKNIPNFKMKPTRPGRPVFQIPEGAKLHKGRHGGSVGKKVGNEELSKWHHLVGKEGIEVVTTIKEEHPDFQVVIVKDGMMVTQDFRLDRVRIWVDENGKVLRVPRVG